MGASTPVSLSNNIDERVNVMNNSQYYYNSRTIAKRLILLAFIANFSACTANFSDGIVLGNEANKLYNDRLNIKEQSLKRYYRNQESLNYNRIDDKDRAKLQSFLDKEV